MKKAFRYIRGSGNRVLVLPILIGDSMNYLKWILPIVSFTGLIPKVKVFKQAELTQALINARFEIEHHWQPGKNKGVFIVARDPAL